jgi:O-antigen ligase
MQRLTPVLDKVVIAALFVFVAFSMFSISIAQIAAGLGGIAWLWRAHLTDSWREQRWFLWIPFGLYILACLIAVANAYDVSYSYQSLKKLLEILIFFWVINCVRENRLRNSLVLVLVIAATTAGLFGFYQGWRDGVSNATRVEGTMSVYMTFAGLLMMVALLTLARLMFKRPQEIWFWFFMVVMSACLVLTQTRQAWFGFLVSFCFLLFMRRKKYLLILATLGFSAIMLVMGPIKKQIQSMPELGGPSLIDQLKYRLHNQLKYRLVSMIQGNDYTFTMRKAIWRGGWEIFKDYPVTGCGFKCVDLVNSQYSDPTGLVERLRGMHNNFLQLAVDTGILGLSAWLGIWFCFFRLLRKRTLALEGEPSDRWVLFGSAAAVIGFLGGGFFETNFYDSEVAMVLYFIMALPFAGSQNEDVRNVKPSPG